MATQAVARNAAHNTTDQSGQIKPALWDQCWPDSIYQADDRRAILIDQLTRFFESSTGWPLITNVRPWFGRTVVDVDYRQLSGINDVREALIHAPLEGLACLNIAIHQTLFVLHAEHTKRTLNSDLDASSKIVCHLTNHPSQMAISAVRSDFINRLVTIRGTVIRATPIRPMVTSMDFVCAKCGAPQEVLFPDGRFVQPTSCGTDGCRSRTLEPIRTSAQCVDWQRIQLQGLPKDERGGEGRVPRPMDVELLEDLAGKCSPGDVVTVTGIVKVITNEQTSGKRVDAKRQCLFVPYIEAISVVAMGKDTSDQRAEPIVVEPLETENYLPPNMPGFTQRDLDFIKAFTESCEGDQLRQLVRSFCPYICSMDAVKCGLLLALFGGVQKGAIGSVPIRGDVHILLVGDPGIGKSQLLQAAAVAAPRGVYVCGTSSSSAGLTVSVAREGGEFFFDAGALVLADRGVCCVDEFDKASNEHGAMLGAMEQQEVAVAKAGLVATLPARTTVLAAANPVDGSYNRGKTLMQNLKMSPAMLSRFDLIFLLLDRPDADRDQRLTEHVLAAHAGLAGAAAAAKASAAVLQESTNNFGGKRKESFAATLGRHGHPTATAAARGSGKRPLLDRLKESRPDDEPLPVQLLRKYIAYARQYCHPQLTEEARVALKEFYLNMRGQSACDSSAPPVTHRQLESLVRLAEARARVDLRDYITLEDAEDVMELMRETLDGMLTEGPAMLDFGISNGGGRGGNKGVAAERRRFVEALQRYCQSKGDVMVNAADLFNIADRIELAVADTHGFIEYLNESGDLLRKGGGNYQFNGTIRPRGTQRQRPTAATQDDDDYGGLGGFGAWG